MSHAEQPVLPGMDVALPHAPLDAGLRRAALSVLMDGGDALRTSDLARVLGHPTRAVAAELVHLRRAGLVRSRAASAGMMRGELWLITAEGRRAMQAPDLSVADVALLGVLRAGPHSTSALASTLGCSPGAAGRVAGRLSRRGLCDRHEHRLRTPRGGMELVHEITSLGAVALTAYDGQPVSLSFDLGE